MSYYHIVHEVECNDKAYEEITKIMNIALYSEATERELINEIPIENIVIEYMKKAHGIYIQDECGDIIKKKDDDFMFYKPFKKYMQIKAPHNYIVGNGCKYISPEYEKYGPFNFVMIHNELSYSQTYKWFRKKYPHIKIFNQLSRKKYAKNYNSY